MMSLVNVPNEKEPKIFLLDIRGGQVIRNCEEMHEEILKRADDQPWYIQWYDWIEEDEEEQEVL